MSEPNNPFAGLLGTSNIATPVDAIPGDENKATQNFQENITEDEDMEAINNIVENVFHFTINPNASMGVRQLVFLEELAEASKPKIYIDLEALEQGLFERLLLTDVENSVVPKSCKVFKEHVVQKQVFPYLFSSLQNMQGYEVSKSPSVMDALQKMKELIFRNAVTALKQPALFEGQVFSMQLTELLQHVDPQSHNFFLDIVKSFMSDGEHILIILNPT